MSASAPTWKTFGFWLDKLLIALMMAILAFFMNQRMEVFKTEIAVHRDVGKSRMDAIARVWEGVYIYDGAVTRLVAEASPVAQFGYGVLKEDSAATRARLTELMTQADSARAEAWDLIFASVFHVGPVVEEEVKDHFFATIQLQSLHAAVINGTHGDDIMRIIRAAEREQRQTVRTIDHYRALLLPRE
ncbi:hypothetical protein [Longimicrobium sp.]|uniref:hypothetical protein n=1 Tax=Longimicrobium sp. TaxID=2029185 RepID=UPI003B3B71C1